MCGVQVGQEVDLPVGPSLLEIMPLVVFGFHDKLSQA